MDTQTKIENMERQIQDLTRQVNSLKASATIPFNVEGAFKKRLNLDAFAKTKLVLSAKNKDSEDKLVNEGGSSTYNVLNDPDGFLEVNILGTIYYLPYYS